MAQLTPALEFAEVTKTYTDGAPVHALHEVTLAVNTGEIFGIVGESGAGKTTFLHLSLGLIAPTSGSIRVLGTPLGQLTPAQLRALRGRIGVVFQGHDLLHNLTAEDNVELPARLTGVRDRARARDLLDFVGLRDRAASYPAQLSGGQQQRVAIARALMTSPQLILFDEPTSALDQGTRQSMLDLIWHTREEFGTTCVIVSHDLDAVKTVCGRAALFESGRLHDTVTVTPPANPATLSYLEQARKQLEA